MDVVEREDSTDTQQCSFCHKLFKCLNKHLWRCTAKKQFVENNDNFRRTVLDLKLLGRLHKAKVSKKQPESLMSNVNKIRDITLATLKKDCKKFSHLHWQAINSGSYYEGVKIDEADEFDVMFICKVNCKIKPPPAKGQRIPDTYVVLEANKECETQCSESSLTLDYTPSFDNKGYSIDFVPAIEFNGFPKESKKTLDMSWIPEKYTDGLCEKIHVVAKTHSSEQRKMPSRRILWRLSFSAAEKSIIYRADGQFAEGQQTCRKDVLRLMKTDLLGFYAKPNQQSKPQEFCSYYLKVLMLNLYDKIPSNTQWEKSTMLLPRYVDALRYWQQILHERLLPYYFIRGENLLEQIGLVEGAKSQLLALHDYVTGLLKTYGD
ncbi:Cyclic GMP-AMP synthase [Lamellibrachia satsuma]|nr:Cyclic GMP-AMP synthase [Lamellibrachia satsuma]